MLELDKIYNMDCMEGMKQIPGNSINCIITDPPYTTPVVTGFGRTKVKNVADLSIQEQYIKCLKVEFERILKSNGSIFIFCDDTYYPSLFRSFYDWQSVQMVIWNKNKIGMGKPFRKQHELIMYANRDTFEYYRNGITFSTVMNYKSIPVKKRYHPAEKPIKLIRDLLIGFSKENDVVLDCFVGGGSVMVACKQLNRKFIGFELNEEYCKIANKRLADIPEKIVSFSQMNDDLNTIIHRNEQTKITT